jgi:hypothetical protein
LMHQRVCLSPNRIEEFSRVLLLCFRSLAQSFDVCIKLDGIEVA